MTTESLPPLKTEGLHIVPQIGGDAIRLVMWGAVEMREPGDLLNPYWAAVDQQTRSRAAKRVELDLRDLNFMNSSGILTLVRWITRLKSHPPGEGYQLVLQYDRNVTWQRTSIPTLAKLAPNVVVPAEINGD